MLRNDKMKSIAELASVLVSLRADGERIIHCHGVFDLLHIGHFRYLQKAANLGDVLVVTVTPDLHVNKGHSRPAFSEHLRAEALSALDCVDYVAVNEWQTAETTIRLLKPDVYAKGAEYRERRTPEIVLENAAADAVGTEVAYIEDITASSSHLINKYLSPFPKAVDQYLIEFSQTHTSAELLHHINEACSLKTLVVGEAIVEEYHYCQPLGQCTKTPIVAMQYLSQERFAGGSLAVANHLAGFCGCVGLLSMLGTEHAEEAWIRKQLKDNVSPTFVHKSGSPTIVKRRYREMDYFRPTFEVYRIDDTPIDGKDNERLCALLQETLPLYDMVIVMDCGHGMLTPEAIRVICDNARFLAVNTQANAGNRGSNTISKYPRVDYVFLHEHELQLECRRNGELRPMLKEVARRLDAMQAVVTRGKHGYLGYSCREGFYESLALVTRVTDPTGADASSLAITSLCAAQGAPLEILSFLGNVASAEAVATMGIRDTLERQSFCRNVESLLK